jgi:hypothetical protein
MTNITLTNLRVVPDGATRKTSPLIRPATHADILAVVKQMGVTETLWCDVHKSSGNVACWRSYDHPETECRMVRVFLVPAEEEDRMPDGRPWPDEGER